LARTEETHTVTLPSDFQVQHRCFERDLRSAERAPKTIKVYSAAVTMFGDYLETLEDEPEVEEGVLITPGRPDTMAEVSRNHIKGFLSYLQDRESQRDGKPLSKGYRNNIFRGLQAFWKWMVLEGNIDYNPMSNIDAPKADAGLVPVLSIEQLKELVGTCGKGRKRSFRDLRDEAILRVLLDTGVRVSELVIDLGGLNMKHQVMTVTGKGNKTRQVHFGDKTAKALDYYLLARENHKDAPKSQALWLGRWGAMSSSGLYQVVVRRGEMIGITDLHPHQFRHTAAHQHRRNKGSTTSLMRLMGWESESMAHRYGASAADELAHEEHASISFGDRI
jgi:site-specific recombinase XerD